MNDKEKLNLLLYDWLNELATLFLLRLLLTSCPVDYCMLLVINRKHISPVSQKERNQLGVPRNNGQMKWCEPVFVTGFDQFGCRHRQVVRRLCRPFAVTGAAIVERRLAGTILVVDCTRRLKKMPK